MEENLTTLREFGGLVVDADELEEFLGSVEAGFLGSERGEILVRAFNFTLQSVGSPLELSFISLYAALESALTYFRRQGEFEILAGEDFARLERDLKAWLKRHPALEGEGAKRALVYEKLRELNRFPFSHVFKKFCRQQAVDLSDLWPLTGAADEWPLMEIRHRLVHGDPFTRRPNEAIACAREHLRWTVERMLLSVLNWPASRSRVGAERLARAGGAYTNWRAERARLA